VDSTSIPTSEATETNEELLAAATSALRLLADRQEHMPEEMLDPRERKVLRQLRTAVRQVDTYVQQ